MRKRKGKLFNDEELEKLKTKCNDIIEMGPITEGDVSEAIHAEEKLKHFRFTQLRMN